MYCRYVHRVGRTARMGKVGEAMLFLMPSERGYLDNLETRGVQLRPLNVLPALDLLPADSTQQVICACEAAVHLRRTYASLLMQLFSPTPDIGQAMSACNAVDPTRFSSQ